jgi:hypothetical protein
MSLTFPNYKPILHFVCLLCIDREGETITFLKKAEGGTPKYSGELFREEGSYRDKGRGELLKLPARGQVEKPLIKRKTCAYLKRKASVKSYNSAVNGTKLHE